MSELDSADILHGLDAIATFFGLPRRVVEHWTATTDIPTFKVGRSVCARRASLRSWVAKRELAARED